MFLGGGEHAAGSAGRVEDVDDLAGLVERVGVRGSRRLTISSITSRGVKCSPAVSLEISENLRISSSKT